MESLRVSIYNDLVTNGDIDLTLVEKLLDAMKNISTPPKPSTLGIIGQNHFRKWMIQYAYVSEKSIKYVRKVNIEDGGLPYVLEVAFGIHKKEGRRIVTGLNWAPALEIPMDEIRDLLGSMRIDSHDPVTVIVHTARPRFEFVDHGKSRVEL